MEGVPQVRVNQIGSFIGGVIGWALKKPSNVVVISARLRLSVT
jgi:hypothetical protein